MMHAGNEGTGEQTWWQKDQANSNAQGVIDEWGDHDLLAEYPDAIQGEEQQEAAAEIRLSFNRESLDNVLTNPDHTPDDLLALFETDFKETLDGSVGVDEGYTLREHTHMVLTQFEKYFRDIPEDDRLLLEVMLALHDIGKPEAVRASKKAAQHAYTKKMLIPIMEQLHYEPSQIALVEALIVGNPIGDFLQGKKTMQDAAEEVLQMSHRSGQPFEKFWSLLFTYYQVDAASYTKDAGGKASLDYLFVFNQDTGTMALNTHISPRVEGLYTEAKARALAKSMSFPITEPLDEWGDRAYTAATTKQPDKTTSPLAELSLREKRKREARAKTGEQPVDYEKEKNLSKMEMDRDDKRYTRYVEETTQRFEAARTAEEPAFMERLRFIQDQLRLTPETTKESERIFLYELAVNAQTFESWKKIFVERDREFLHQHSQEVLRKLQGVFQHDVQTQAKAKDLHEAGHLLRRREAFANMPLHPIHGSQSPRRLTEIVASRHLPVETKLRTGSGDTFIGGDRFVYGSFAEIPHPMSGSGYPQIHDRGGEPDPLPATAREAKKGWKEHMNLDEGQYLLDESGFNDADVAMFDIHFSKIGPKSETGGFLDTYLRNYFDYETGKEIVRAYLRLVFESPEEAMIYMGGWSEMVFEKFYKEHSDNRINTRLGRARSEEIHQKMRQIYYELGIAPPMMHEVRIPDRADIIPSPAQKPL